MNNKYIIYFTEAQMYLFSARTRVRSIEVAKKYTNVNSAKKLYLNHYGLKKNIKY